MRRRETWKRGLSLLMALVMVLGYLPAQHVHAASNVEGGLEGQAADVFTALGFDTTVMPEGYDPNTVDNPYGRTKITGTQIWEALVANENGLTTVGTGNGKINNDKTVSDVVNAGVSGEMPLKMFAAAPADFDNDGLLGEAVYVGFSTVMTVHSSYKDLKLYTFDAKTGTFSDGRSLGYVSNGYMAGENEIMDRREEINYMYAAQNMLQVTAGDYDGDGTYEIAVFVGEDGNSRVDIYKQMKTASTAAGDWMTMSNWSVVWSYVLSNSSVPNMVSLHSADINQDGMDDLAISSGEVRDNLDYYLGGTNFTKNDKATKSTAVILWGDRSKMLQNKYALNLDAEGLGELARVSITTGDLNDDGYDEIVVAGQPLADVFKNTSRTAIVYNYDGNGGLVKVFGDTFKIVDGYYKEGEWVSNNGFDEEYYSESCMKTNVAVFRPQGYDYAYVYLDSCLFEYVEGALTLKMCLDDESYDGTNSLETTWLSDKYYGEFGVVAMDLNGEGYHQLVTSYYTKDSCLRSEQMENGLPEVSYKIDAGLGGLQGSDGTLIAAGKSKSYHVDEVEYLGIYEWVSPETMCPFYVIAVNCDKDTTILEYTGNHWLTYQDPKVLAVVAAAPYFEDVDVICDYDYAWQNTTSWSRTEGSGHGTTVQVDLEAGAYVSQGSKFNELEVAALFTMEWAKESTEMTEYTLTFETSQDEDAVAFFSIPTEHYEYTIYAPNESGEYETDYHIVSRPFQAVYQVLNLDYYESIRGDYSNLPAIRGEILKSTPGDPSSYPASTSGYDVITKWNDDPAGVSFGNGAITQEITITQEESESYNLGAAVDTQAGGGYDGETFSIMVGVTFSLNPSGGWMDYEIEGTTIAGTVTNMPLEFQDYGYYYDWALFSYAADVAGSRVPVVSYLVNNVSEPPQLPDDFQQDVERTTSDKNVLTWTYDQAYSSFILYKYFDFPVGGGLQEIARFEAGEAPYTIKYDENGKLYYEFYYEDTNLAPYSEYQYAIQVERLSEVPPLSAPSGLLAARTKARSGNPVLTIAESDGTNDGYATVYPDKNTHLIAQVSGPDGQPGAAYYTTIQYQWQRKNDQGKWEDMVNETNQTLTIETAGAAVTGEYRCRVNVITNTDNTAISAYTGFVELVHSKRTSVIQEAYAVDMAGNVKLYAKVVNAHTDSATVPDGYVTFNFVNTANGASYPVNVPLDTNGVATVISENALPEGQYRVAVTYSGSYIFKSSTAEVYYLSGKDGGYAMEAPEAVTYGDGAEILFQRVYKDGSLTRTEPVEATEITAAYKYSARLDSVIGILRIPEGCTEIVEGDTVTAGTQYCVNVGSGHLQGDTSVLYTYFRVFTPDRSGVFYGAQRYAGGAYVVPEEEVLQKGDGTGVYILKDSAPVEDYSIIATAADGTVVEQEISVTPRPVTLQLPTLVKKQDSGLTMGDITYGELEVLSGSWAICDSDENGNVAGDVADTSVSPSYINTAGTAYDHETLLDTCGYYTIDGADNLDNYAVTYRTGSLSVIGGNQPVTFGVRPFEGEDVGTLYMVSPDYAYTREEKGLTLAEAVGSRVIFTAAPDDGYQVYDWYVDGVAQGVTDTRFAYVMLNQAATVEVQFVFKPDTLVYGMAGATEGGTLVCSDSSLTSGSIVIPNTYLTFTAKAQEGYHFKEWRYTELGKGTAYYAEDDGKMSSTFQLLMPKNSCSLYAVFERDGYTFTYTDKAGIDGLTAWYWGNSSGDSTAALEKITVNSGDAVPGDTEVVVQPRDGFALDEDYNFVSTGSQGVADYANGTYTVTVTEDTEIMAYTVQNFFDVVVKFAPEQIYRFPEGTVITLTVGDREYVSEVTEAGEIFSLQDVDGGSFITVEASFPDYYTFSGWDLNGTNLNFEKYTVALARNNTFTLKLTEKPVYKVTLADISGKGTYTVTLPEGAGQEGNVVTCHENDPLTIQVTPEGGYTVTYWNVTSGDSENSWESKANSLKYQFPQLTADYTFTPVFSGTTYHTVTWPTLRYFDVTLKPEEGYLSTVSSGGEFKFTLSGGEEQYEYVLVNGQKFYDDTIMGDHYPFRYLDVDGVRIYSIYNITANQEITVSLEEPVYGVTITPAEAEVGAGKTVTLTAEGYGINLDRYKWSIWSNDTTGLHVDVLQQGPGNTLVYEAPLTPGQSVTITLQAGNSDNGIQNAIVSANALIHITDAVDTIAVTSGTLTPAEDGSYLVYPITPDNTTGKYDFDALVTMYSGETHADVTWSLWGAQMRGTSIDADGLLTVSPREYGMNSQLKITATYTYPDGNTDQQDVIVNLCPDAYVATKITGADHGDVVADIGYVSDGTAVTVTATPDENHAVAAWYINGVAVTGEAADSMTFTAEEMTHYTVSVEFTHYYPELKHDETEHWYECSCGDRSEVQEHQDFDKEHFCDKCGYEMSQCTDENKDHICDWCGVRIDDCYDEIKDHNCDWCGDKISVCVDEDPVDHVCDWCGGSVGEHADINGNHFCDHCGKQMTECADEKRDHNCDVCGRTLTTCGDADSNHLCDICGEELSQCVDAEPVDHKCDICGETVSACADNNNDHDCDACGKEDITSCTDNDDHKCDICGEVLSQCADEDQDHNCDLCGKTVSDCADENKDHACDICGDELTQCTDEDKDHNCDLCGEPLTDCADDNDDHKCDLCGETVSECTDEDRDHYCDICGKHLSACVDENEDRICDICDKELSVHDCADGNKDHLCDTCGTALSECADEDQDHNCDLCGETLSECADSETDEDHNCDLCGAVLGECADGDRDHKCDVCGVELTQCADGNEDHLCDTCGDTVSECADEDRDHLCDTCGEILSECADEDGDHLCDVCGNVLSICADEEPVDHKCDICGIEMDLHADADPKDHICDLESCGKVLSQCIDSDKDHLCDTCDEILSDCADDNNDHDCDICGKEDITACEDEDDHLCDICGETLSECADEDLDHACDVCGAVLTQCADEDEDGRCDICGADMHACSDEDPADHLCDVCGFPLSTCTDEDQDHKCDICGGIMGQCYDEEPADHRCDYCGAELTQCADQDRDHNCDLCGETVSECTDEDHDDVCDICGAEVNVHADTDSDHRCDVCALPLSECADGNKDHLCDVCGVVWSICADEDKNHACDICGTSVGYHGNSEGSHICEYCGEVFSICGDTALGENGYADHLCDVCGQVLSECLDEIRDHLCDICGKQLSDCADEDRNHACDWCGAEMGYHGNGDKSHVCEYCGETVSECADQDKDHFCDLCEAQLSECVDENADHVCEYCGETISGCIDEDKDHFCDVCGKKLSDHSYSEGKHICEYCGEPAILCYDHDTDHICDLCEKVLSDCADEDKDHFCDYCGKELDSCVDADKDHFCDHCGAELSVCADENKDGACDHCGAELGFQVIFPEDDNSGTIVPGAEADLDGKTVELNEDGELWLEKTGGRLLTTYKFNESDDPHKEYPVAMYVWYVTWTDTNDDGTEDTGTAERISQLDNFLTYKGTSIRVNSDSDGIRFFTDVPAAAQTALTEGTLLTGVLEGYRLVEMGTLYKWAATGTELTTANGAPSYVYGGDAGEKFRLFSKEGSYNRFTGMLVGLDGDAETLAADIVSRPFVVLENADGDQITIYGGSIQRSIYYVALQNRDYWADGTAHDKYVENIIATVEGA